MRTYNFINKILLITLLVFIVCTIFPIESHSQQDNEELDFYFYPAVALNNIVQHSNAIVLNNYLHPGTVSGIKDNDTIFIKDVKPLDTCIIETKNYDKLLFFWDYVGKTTKIHKTQYFYFNVSPKKEFEMTPIPIKQLSGNEITGYYMKFDNKELGKLIGQKLYEVKIVDEVNQNQIEVLPLENSKPFIDVWKVDSGTTYAIYHIKLKSNEEFFNNLSEDQNKKWSKGEEINIPIGIKLADKYIPSFDHELNYNLVKIKKQKNSKK